MKYYTAIITLIFFNIAAIVSLLYFGNGSSLIKEENKKILIEINNEKERLKINELEYSLYTNYNYLEKIHKIYFDNINLFFIFLGFTDNAYDLIVLESKFPFLS